MKKFILFFAVVFFATITMNAQTDNSSKIVLDSLAANGTRIVEYKPAGVCSRLIHIEVNKKGVVENVVFTGGCNGYAKGIGALIKGMKSKEAIERLQGITCGKKSTSCPDQLAQALIEISKKK